MTALGSEAEWQVLDEFRRKQQVYRPNRSGNSKLQGPAAAAEKNREEQKVPPHSTWPCGGVGTSGRRRWRVVFTVVIAAPVGPFGRPLETSFQHDARVAFVEAKLGEHADYARARIDPFANRRVDQHVGPIVLLHPGVRQAPIEVP